MSQTEKYGLRYPGTTAAVRDGATAIQQLAADVEAALLGPMLLTVGAADPTYSNGTGYGVWSLTSGVRRSRGTWTSPTPAAPAIIVPPSPGIYLVNAAIRFGGKSEADSFGLAVDTVNLNDTSSAVGWGQQRVEVADTSASFTNLHVTALAAVPDAVTGIRITCTYIGSQAPTNPAPDGVHKLQIYRMSAL